MNDIDVFYHDRLVGHLASDSEGRFYFSYSPAWIKEGFSISPVSLPLTEKIFVADPLRFEGIHGVFHDSLPDGWGTLTAIKALGKKGINYLRLSPLERLAYLGSDGLGALRYKPNYEKEADFAEEEYDSIALSMMAIEADKDADYDAVFALSGSTGGARPKAHLLIDNEEWIVKFRQRNDPLWMGRMEYEYALAAKEAGMEVPEVRLLPSSLCEGYFATKRFDRKDGVARHTLSLSALLESPHDRPFLDYLAFLQATQYLTKSTRQTLEAFRRACFNVLAKNYDDHGKNFAFLYDESARRYLLAPAYDLTYTPNQREHEMTCMGNGNPGISDLRALYKKLYLPTKTCEEIIATMNDVVSTRLCEWMMK